MPLGSPMNSAESVANGAPAIEAVKSTRALPFMSCVPNRMPEIVSPGCPGIGSPSFASANAWPPPFEMITASVPPPVVRPLKHTAPALFIRSESASSELKTAPGTPGTGSPVCASTPTLSGGPS